jgi:hypothetical protein
MNSAENRSVRELLVSLSEDLVALISQTAGIARAELGTAAKKLAWSVAGIAAGAISVMTGLVVLLSARVLIVMALGAPPWVAALLVGVILVGAGAGVAWLCLGRIRHLQFALSETQRSVKETITWLKEQASR